jgi:hypothetical protein
MLIPIALGNPLLLWFRFPHLSASDPSPAYYVAFPSPRLADTLQKTPVVWQPYPSFRESTVASQLSVNLPFPFPFPYPCSRRCPCPLRLRPLLLSLELLLQQFPYCCCISCFRCHYYPTTNATIAITTATATSIATTTAATATTATTATMTFYYPVSCDHNGDHWYYFTEPAHAPVTTDASTADAAPLPQLLLLL